MLDSLDTLIAFVVIMLVVSMLITICVQLVSALLNLRGKYLGQGLSHTFSTILPGLGTKAETLACRILSGRLLSDSKAPLTSSDSNAAPSLRRCATAARPDEVFDALHRIATGRSERLADLRDDARAILKGLGVSDEVLAAAQAGVAAAVGKIAPNAAQISEAARQTIAQLPEAQRAPIEAAIDGIAQKLTAYETTAVQGITQGAAEIKQALEEASKKFQYWFEVSQERAQQWFTTHTRWWTVIFAVGFTFVLQLDTVEIFDLVSSDKAVRDKLVAQVSVVTNQAERIVADGTPVLKDALKNWREALPDQATKDATPDLDDVGPTETRGSLRGKVDAALGQATGKEKLLADFDEAVNKSTQKALDAGVKNYTTVKSSLDDTGFKLFVNDWKGRWGNGRWRDLPPHFLGMLFSVGLLSLGAPFWFNALKSLANLRSRVAQNISTEQKGDKPAPGTSAGSDSSAPPTVAPTT